MPKLHLAFLLVALMLNGCASNRNAPNQPSASPSSGKWFCQMAEEPTAWECVQNAELAENPAPSRFPKPPPEPLEDEDEAVAAADEPAAAPSVDLPATATLPATAASSETVERSTGRPIFYEDSPTPVYQQVAFRPPQATPLTDLPADYYTVQLLAVASREVLEQYVEDEDISGLSAAQIERDGELFYVLLLGVYEDEERAKIAATHLPEQIGYLTPWVRKLGSLQDAMRRAELTAPKQLYSPESAVPIHEQVAFRPEQSVRLTDLPEDYYTVQLLAVTSKELLEEYVQGEQIAGLTAARVERDQELYYVLLLGVYQDEHRAKTAASHLPEKIQYLTPWVRRLGSLQQAMLRADELAGSPDF